MIVMLKKFTNDVDIIRYECYYFKGAPIYLSLWRILCLMIK